jgi:hypothetical protein
MESLKSVINFEDLEIYEYSTLQEAYIRVFELLPGEFGDDVMIRIIHTLLRADSSSQKPSRWTLKELRRTLSPRWAVHETIEGRFIFRLRNPANANHYLRTQWNYPDVYVPRSKYDFPCDGKVDGSHGFEGLSYTWGSDSDGEWVAIEVGDGGSSGQEKKPKRKLFVRRNLMMALRYLRDSGNRRRFWVDAICINQSNNEEKGRQV